MDNLGGNSSMTTCKPYLVRAVHEWIEDNGCTPYLLVDAEFPGVQVPFEYVKDGQIVLNISSGATGNLTLGEHHIEFNARFGGSPRHVVVPMSAVLFVYARENGEGMPFPPEAKPEADETQDEEVIETSFMSIDGNQPDHEKPEKPSKANHLKVIK
ncbi:ClpXP protease specificity-enhancing factor [Catenovulum sediminis]|uniref:ClpXP protease specificity-enhancing factor n=1 Tax=Catenovulum sediminis TaxID=1740262 RepID=A0ABV1RK50_9ALTE|nr:ClpXP protease specificity-enhancing factor [Catenovulum sediminis]